MAVLVPDSGTVRLPEPGSASDDRISHVHLNDIWIDADDEHPPVGLGG